LSSATSRQHTLLSAALDASLQARDLVRNLMSLTQRDEARSNASADLREVVARVEGMCRATFPREITFHHEIVAELANVAMPAGDLEQVLLNLLLNARDALEHPSIKVREIAIRAQRSVDQPGVTMAELRVTDTGPGMSEDVRTRVFEPFFTTKPSHKGSGLGLSNVAVRVHAAGGSIRCDSVPGAGTTFIVVLPLAAAQPASPESAPAPSASTQTSATILLVDDEQAVRSVLRALLEYEGYTVLEASSAEHARETLASLGVEVELVILDQSMPRETGSQALSSLRALTRAPIVLFTGMAPELAPDVDAVLGKPARPAELQRVVRELLSKRA